LKFKLDGVVETLNVEECTAEQFNIFAQAVADVDNVDTSVWPLEERRNLVNGDPVAIRQKTTFRTDCVLSAMKVARGFAQKCRVLAV
jgi:hypothetical protein